MKNLILLIALLPFNSYANMGSFQKDVEPVIISNFCIVKKELPAGVQFKFKNDSTFEFITQDGSVTLLKESPDKVILPRGFKTQHLPVIKLEKNKVFTVDNNSWKPVYANEVGNPLAYGYNSHFRIGPSGPILMMPKSIPITDEELKSLVVIPFNYYQGDQFVSNKLKISLQKTTKGNFEIIKIVPEIPYPKGLSITGKNFNLPKKEELYASLDFKYSGDSQLIFVKEYNQVTIDLPYIKENTFPIYINDKGKCLKSSISEPEVLSRKDNLEFYEEYNSQFVELMSALGGNKEFEEFVESIRNQDLYEVFPLGHIFSGNGRLDTKCESNFQILQSLFDTDEVDIKPMGNNGRDLDFKIINIPDEKSKAIYIVANGAKSSIQILKRNMINRDWKPKSHDKENIECDPFCPNVFAEKKINYFKNSKINYPKSLYSNEDLICGMPSFHGQNHTSSSKALRDLLSF